MPSTHTAACLVLVLSALACQKAPAQRAAGAPPPSSAEARAPLSAEPKLGEPTSAAPAPVDVSEDEARGLLDAWLGAQNSADFGAYSELYASRFEGVKRVGERATRFDRAGWLADRQRMFEPPRSGSAMSVEATEVTLHVSATAARARFTQSYSRGGFNDRGSKELVLVRERGALRIAREEMLRSEVLSRASRSAADAGGFFFVIEQGVVLSDDARHDAARGPLEAMPNEGFIHVVRAAANEELLSPAVRRMKGRNVRLEGSAECSARIGELWLLVRVDPHFGTVNGWAGRVEEDGVLKDTGKAATDEEIAREVWQLGSPVVVGELLDVPPGCAGRWARDALLPPVAQANPVVEAAAAVRVEAERQMIAAVARIYPPEPGAAPPDMELHRIGGKQPLVVGRYSRGEGCADSMRATFVWRLHGSDGAPRLELVNDPQGTAEFQVELALDLDGDGRWELLGNMSSRLLEPAHHYQGGPSLEITALDCYC